MKKKITGVAFWKTSYKNLQGERKQKKKRKKKKLDKHKVKMIQAKPFAPVTPSGLIRCRGRISQIKSG